MLIIRADSSTSMDTSKVVASTPLSLPPSLRSAIPHFSHSLSLTLISLLIHLCQNQQFKQHWVAKWITTAQHLALRATMESLPQPTTWNWMDWMFHTGHESSSISLFCFHFCFSFYFVLRGLVLLQKSSIFDRCHYRIAWSSKES